MLLAPIGALDLVRRSADTAVAAAAATGVPSLISTRPARRWREIAAAASELVQLYWSTSDELVDASSPGPRRPGAGRRRHPRHDDARLAPAGRDLRAPAVRPRHQHRQYLGPGVPAPGRRDPRPAPHRAAPEVTPQAVRTAC
ncbi:hypothetical protein HBB16_15080 [Pseudonocardia sp. MCCB 268]|nr:hypothetical protein [Pseudonocardia cytotoxica]